MPLLRAFPLGLLLYGTVEVTLADGSTAPKITAKGAIEIEGETEVGVVILEPSMTDILLGMDFLRKFNRVLLVDPSDNSVLLISGEHFAELTQQQAAANLSKAATATPVESATSTPAAETDSPEE